MVPFTLAIALLTTLAVADPPKPIGIGHIETLRSEILNEDRTLFVHLPPDYSTGDHRYQVVVVLDGRSQFQHTATTVDFLARTGSMPPAIVVGVANTDRTRDLTPGHQDDFETSGGADAFLSFLAKELLPHVDAKYRTRPYRVLIGHSFGGLFAVHALSVERPAFQAFLAISPSLWWDNARPVERIKAAMASTRTWNHRIYATLGDEGGNMSTNFDRFVELMKTAPNGLEGSTQRLPDEDHLSVPLRSTILGLRWIYDGFDMGASRGTDFAALQTHCEQLSKRFGYAVLPPEAAVNQMGYRAFQEGDVEKGIEILTVNVTLYPGSANVHDSLGDALKAAGRWEEAADSYARAVQRGEEIDDPNLEAYRANLAAAKARLSAESEAKPSEWVVVATYLNPSMSKEAAAAEERLFALLKEAKINRVSAGSRGFSLNVASRDADRARAIIEKAIKSEGLAASVAARKSNGG